MLCAVLCLTSFGLLRRDAKALALLSLLFTLIGFLRAQLPDIFLLPDSLVRWSAALSRSAQAVLQDTGLSRETTTVLEAMLLGVRDNLPVEIRDLYRQAGAAHVLALSGLHLGILFGIFSYALQRVLISHWRYAVGSIGIVMMWGYAMLTGFPVSLCRASLMMTFLVVSQMRLVGTNSWHTLGLAAFLLLLLAPSSLFDIGFQLSFAAVAGILLFYAPLCNIWNPRSKTLNTIWKVSIVSVAAQLSVFPLSVYYFHQFTIVSLITSPLIIFKATCLLYLALLFLLLHAFGWGACVAWCLERLVAVLHVLMAASVRVPWSRVEHVDITLGELLLLYMAVLCLLPPLYALKQQPREQPASYRWALFFRTWPYLLSILLLIITICLI